MPQPLPVHRCLNSKLKNLHKAGHIGSPSSRLVPVSLLQAVTYTQILWSSLPNIPSALLQSLLKRLLCSPPDSPQSPPISPTAVKSHKHIILQRSPSCYKSFRSKKSTERTLKGKDHVLLSTRQHQEKRAFSTRPELIKPQHSYQNSVKSYELGSFPPYKKGGCQFVLLSVILWHTHVWSTLGSLSRFSITVRKKL